MFTPAELSAPCGRSVVWAEIDCDIEGRLIRRLWLPPVILGFSVPRCSILKSDLAGCIVLY